MATTTAPIMVFDFTNCNIVSMVGIESEFDDTYVRNIPTTKELKNDAYYLADLKKQMQMKTGVDIKRLCIVVPSFSTEVERRIILQVC
jgi:hypothetical protein